MSFILEDYAIVASLSEIQSPERCIDIIQNYSRRLLIELNEDPVDALRRGNIKLLRLAELVGISREHLTAALGLAMVNIGEPRKALDLCEDLLRTRMTAPLAKLFSKIISSVALYCADNCSCLVNIFELH
jgi:hypothetical protein